MKKFHALLVLFLAVSAAATAQVDAGVKVTPKQKDGEMLDSVKQTAYPYRFPLLGKRVASKGFILPYPVGVMLNFFRGSQEVTISNLSVGIADASGAPVVGPVSLDDVVTFGDVRAAVTNANMRADLWLLPFMDVYGIFGKAWVKTSVDIDAIMDYPVDISTAAKFDGYVYGMGTMLTGGVRSIFFSLDWNVVWTHFDEMENDNTAMNLSLRTGYVFHLKRSESNIAVWGGAGRVFLNNTTKGSVPLSEIAPDLGTQYQSSAWYQDLTPVQQRVVDAAVENFTDKSKGDIINYSLDKRPGSNWTMILGAQYQLNRRWQFRTEVNVLGGRRSALMSANYRFGIK